MIIDAHVNITHDGKWFNTDHDASLERLMDEMDMAGVDGCLLISMPFATTNRYVASVIEKYSDRFKGLGYLDFEKNDMIKQIDELISMGFSGIKIHPRMQGVNCNDNKLEYLFDYIDEKLLAVMIDGYYQTNNNKILLPDLEPFKYDLLAKRFPNISFIISHLGGHRTFDLFFVARSNKNLFIDNSHALMYFYGTSLINDFVWVMDKLDEKIFFGSDFPEYGLKEYLDHFNTIVSNTKTLRKELVYTNINKIVDFGGLNHEK